MIEIEILIEDSSREIKAVRGGKVITKKVRLAKLPKKMSMKQRLALKKARRKAHTAMAKKKRKKSMKRRARIPQAVQARSADIAAQRRKLARHEELEVDKTFISIEDTDELLIAEVEFEFMSVDGEQHYVEQGYMVDINEDDTGRITLDVYDDNGDPYLEEVEVTLETILHLINSGILAAFYDPGDEETD